MWIPADSIAAPTMRTGLIKAGLIKGGGGVLPGQGRSVRAGRLEGKRADGTY